MALIKCPECGKEISDKASATLYNIRRSLKEKNSSVREKINSIVRSNSKYLQDAIYTMRGERYVLPVKAEYKGAVPGLVHDQSSTGATLFIEPLSLVNLNNEIKELMLKEKAEIEEETPSKPSVFSQSNTSSSSGNNVFSSASEGNGHIIGIDPGHQSESVDMSALEPNGPGSSEMKAKCSTGTQGSYSGVPEYQLNLEISLQLRDELEQRLQRQQRRSPALVETAIE